MKKILIFSNGDSLEQILVMLLQPSGLDLEPVLFKSTSLDPDEKTFQGLLARANEFAAVIWHKTICVKGKSVNTFAPHGHIGRFSKVFHGPMFAWCGDMDPQRHDMRAVGCTHRLPSGLTDFATSLPDFLAMENCREKRFVLKERFVLTGGI